MSLVLASGSARRRDLLRSGGLDPTIAPADVDETPHPGEAATALVRRLATSKATAVDGRVVLGADTEVVRDGVALGKPVDRDHARSMLRANAGRVLTIWSGVAVAADGAVTSQVVGSFLRFAVLTDAQVAAYLATGEPLDVAGAFRIQGRGADLVTARTGCWTNVVGLPTCQSARLLAPHGIRLVPDGCQPAMAS